MVLTPNFSSLPKVLYNPKAVIAHAAWLDQAFAHCPIFPTAAFRRSPGRVSVPMWLVILSNQLRIVALVSFYLTNKLIGRGLIVKRQARRSPALMEQGCPCQITFGISFDFSKLFRTLR